MRILNMKKIDINVEELGRSLEKVTEMIKQKDSMLRIPTTDSIMLMLDSNIFKKVMKGIKNENIK